VLHAVASHAGTLRDLNQDATMVDPRRRLVAAIDGFGFRGEVLAARLRDRLADLRFFSPMAASAAGHRFRQWLELLAAESERESQRQLTTRRASVPVPGADAAVAWIVDGRLFIGFLGRRCRAGIVRTDRFERLGPVADSGPLPAVTVLGPLELGVGDTVVVTSPSGPGIETTGDVLHWWSSVHGAAGEGVAAAPTVATLTRFLENWATHSRAEFDGEDLTLVAACVTAGDLAPFANTDSEISTDFAWQGRVPMWAPIAAAAAVGAAAMVAAAHLPPSVRRLLGFPRRP